jgi:hypothetical protein
VNLDLETLLGDPPIRGFSYNIMCDRTILEMRGSSPKVISGDSRRSENAQTQHISIQYHNI